MLPFPAVISGFPRPASGLVILICVLFSSLAAELVPEIDLIQENRPRVLVRPDNTSLAISLEQLATVAVGTLSDVLGVQRGALVMIARGSDRVTLRVTEGMGHIETEEITLALDSPILLHLMMAGEPFFQHDLDHHPDVQTASPQERDALHALGIEIYLPILARERVLGLLVLGPPSSGEPYGEHEVTFLNTLAQQTGVALQNAYLYSRMKGLYDKISRLNEDLRTAYTRLMKMDQAKTDFLSIASHELRTPLTVIQGYTDILEELAGSQELPPGRILEIVKNLKTPIERLGTIVTAMLDASTIEVHALDLQYTATSLQAVISMAIGPWREALEERNFDLVIEGIDDVPPVPLETFDHHRRRVVARDADMPDQLFFLGIQARAVGAVAVIQ